MNHSDKKLLSIALLIVIVLFGVLFFTSSKDNKNALVYYEDQLLLTIDLSKEGNNYYEVDGALGKVKLETHNGKIRVIEENSPNHLCSKQGFIQESYQVLICLPNKVVVKIEAHNEIDTVVK